MSKVRLRTPICMRASVCGGVGGWVGELRVDAPTISWFSKFYLVALDSRVGEVPGIVYTLERAVRGAGRAACASRFKPAGGPQSGTKARVCVRAMLLCLARERERARALLSACP